MGRPTFLTKEELEAKRSPVSKNPEPDPDPETRTTTDPMGKTRVKERVEKLNMRTQNSPGKFPAAKQSLIHVYFTRKSPKAKQAREKKLKITETQNTELQGALKSPLLGESNQPGTSKETSEGPCPVPEARGGVWGGGGRNKALKVLEKLPLALKASSGGQGKSRPRKRCQDTQEGKEVKCRKITRDEGRKQG